MSFGKRLRAERRSSLALVALFSSLSLGGAVAAPVEAQQAATQTAPKEFTPGQVTKRQTPAPVVNRITPKGKGRYDSRKARRRLLMVLADSENTGRQWVRVRRDIRRGPLAYLLNMPAHELARIAQSYRIVRAA